MVVKDPEQLIYVPNEHYGLSDWVPLIDDDFVEIDTHSWFDIRICKNPFEPPPKKHITNTAIIPTESFIQQMKTIRRRKLDKEPVFLCTKKIRIYPTEWQKFILDEWFNAATRMYNITLYYVRRGIFIDHILMNIDSVEEYLKHTDFRSILKNDRDKIIQSMDHPIVGHLLDEIINHVVSSYKTCITNLKNGNIKKFRIRSWQYHRRRYILKIESNLFRSGTFCGRTFPSMKSSDPLTNVLGSSRPQNFQYEILKSLIKIYAFAYILREP